MTPARARLEGSASTPVHVSMPCKETLVRGMVCPGSFPISLHDCISYIPENKGNLTVSGNTLLASTQEGMREPLPTIPRATEVELESFASWLPRAEPRNKS